MKRFLLTFEKVGVRIGAILGVLSTIILLRSKVLKPSPPNVESSSDTG
jgi:hypothetical protein